MEKSTQPKITITEVFNDYGGWKCLCKSLYLRASIVLLVLTWSQWSKPGWWDTVFQIVPNLLGFTIGAFALTIAFGDSAFLRILSKAEDEKGVCALREMSATFLVFIAVQVSAIVTALVFKALWEVGPIGFRLSDGVQEAASLIGLALWGFSYLLFLYGIVMSLAAAKWIHMLATTFAVYLRRSDNGK